VCVCECECVCVCVCYPITGQKCPEDSRKLWFPDYVTMAQDGGKVSPTHRPRFISRKYSWYSFMLEAELTLGP